MSGQLWEVEGDQQAAARKVTGLWGERGRGDALPGVFQISFVHCGEIPLFPLGSEDEASWEEHQPSVSRLA